MQSNRGIFRVVLLIAVLAGALRLYAAQHLYGDDDEATYMKRAVDYANFLRSGEYGMLAAYDLNYEHPSFYKILYGVALLTRGPIEAFSTSQVPWDQPMIHSEAATWMLADRYVSVLFGTLTATLLAIVNPMAGLFLSVNTLSVKYTSEVYLEAFPMFTGLLCAVTYLHWFARASENSAGLQRNDLWLAGSAVSLGLTAASKYIYCVVSLAVLLHFVIALFRRQIRFPSLYRIVAWGTLAIVTFFAFNPYLWPDPIGRLSQSVQYNLNYSQSDHVIESGYPFWQPFRWLFSFSSFYDLRPRWAFLFDIDTPIFLLAVMGLPRLFLQRRFYFYWLMVAMIFLLIWNTKWPQYTLIALAPLSVSASEGVISAWNLARKFFA